MAACLLAAPALAQEAKPKKDRRTSPPPRRKKSRRQKKEKNRPRPKMPWREVGREKRPEEIGREESRCRRKGRPDDPAVAAILETKPTTPAECVRAAKTLADLGRADLAKDFLKKVLDAKLDPQQLADLGEQFGVADVSRPGRAAGAAARGQATGRRGGGGRPSARLRRRQADRRLDPAASRPVGGEASSSDGRLAGSAGRGHRAAHLRCWPIRPARPNTPTCGRRWPRWAGSPAVRWWPSSSRPIPSSRLKPSRSSAK